MITYALSYISYVWLWMQWSVSRRWSNGNEEEWSRTDSWTRLQLQPWLLRRMKHFHIYIC